MKSVQRQQKQPIGTKTRCNNEKFIEARQQIPVWDAIRSKSLGW